MNAVSIWTFLVVAFVLSLERLCYAWVWRHTDIFRELCTHPMVTVFGQPIDVLRKLFYGFKGVQLGVFLWWCVVYGQESNSLASSDTAALGGGMILIVVGQLLNFMVFYRLARLVYFTGTSWAIRYPAVPCSPSRYSAILNILERLPPSGAFFWPCAFRMTTGTYCPSLKPSTMPGARISSGNVFVLARRFLLCTQRPARPGLFVLGVVLCACGLLPRLSQAGIFGIWAPKDNRVQVQLFPCRDAVCGKIVRLQEDGQTPACQRLDRENPDPDKRRRRVLGTTDCERFSASTPSPAD